MIIENLKEIIENPELIFKKKGTDFLNNIKEKIRKYEDFMKEYNTDINDYNDYKKSKANLKKLNEINKLFKYIGKESIDSIIESVSLEIKNNKKYQITEDLSKFGIKNENLTDKLSDILLNYKGKSNYFFENKKACFLFDSKIETETLNRYDPIIFQNKKYTKIILKEV
jgi:hypothetical protein